jgi:hypothetical protein
MKEAWVQSLLTQCRDAGVPFFFKQWGGVQKKKNGRELSGRTYDEFPVTEAAPIPCGLERRGMATKIQATFEVSLWQVPTIKLTTQRLQPA